MPLALPPPALNIFAMMPATPPLSRLADSDFAAFAASFSLMPHVSMLPFSLRHFHIITPLILIDFRHFIIFTLIFIAADDTISLPIIFRLI